MTYCHNTLVLNVPEIIHIVNLFNVPATRVLPFLLGSTKCVFSRLVVSIQILSPQNVFVTAFCFHSSGLFANSVYRLRFPSDIFMLSVFCLPHPHIRFVINPNCAQYFFLQIPKALQKGFSAFRGGSYGRFGLIWL